MHPDQRWPSVFLAVFSWVFLACGSDDEPRPSADAATADGASVDGRLGGDAAVSKDASAVSGADAGTADSGELASDASCLADASDCRWQCDMVLQDCPSGQKCNAVMTHIQDPWRGTVCVDDNRTEGGGLLGDICFNMPGGGDTCGPGSMCVQFGTGEGDCRAFCRPAAEGPACPAGTLCAGLDGEGRVRLCFDRCHPLLKDCPSEEHLFGCYPEQGGFACLPWRLGGRGRYQDPCERHLDCAPGHFCAAAEQVPGCAAASGCCSTFCDINESDSCPGAAEGEACQPFYPPGDVPAGQENVGLCVVLV